MIYNLSQTISASMPACITKNNALYISNLAINGGRLLRMVTQLSDQVLTLSPNVQALGKATYFVSAIKLPGSLYNFIILFLKIKQVSSFSAATIFSVDLTQKIILIAKDMMYVLKGMKAFGVLDKRYFWILKPSPFFCLMTSFGLCYRLYLQTLEMSNCKLNLLNFDPKGKRIKGDDKKLNQLENRVKAATIAVFAAALDICGVAILSISPFVATPVLVPAYSLLTLSSVASFAKTVFYY